MSDFETLFCVKSLDHFYSSILKLGQWSLFKAKCRTRRNATLLTRKFQVFKDARKKSINFRTWLDDITQWSSWPDRKKFGPFINSYMKSPATLSSGCIAAWKIKLIPNQKWRKKTLDYFFLATVTTKVSCWKPLFQHHLKNWVWQEISEWESALFCVPLFSTEILCIVHMKSTTKLSNR